MSLHRVARFTDVPQDRGLQVEIGDCKIVLLRANGQLRAFQGLCPHAGRRWRKARCVMEG